MSKKKKNRKKKNNIKQQKQLSVLNSKTNFEKLQNNQINLEKPKKKNYFHIIVEYIKEKQLFNKMFTIVFAAIVFSYVYIRNKTVNPHAIAYIGLILYMVICYTEVLSLRDHLWIIEGSIPESRKWREDFFNPRSLRKQKIKKILALLFAFLVFTAIYKIKYFYKTREALSFVGIILMVTVVYYEILTVRDEINHMVKSLQQSFKESDIKDSMEEKDEKKL